MKDFCSESYEVGQSELPRPIKILIRELGEEFRLEVGPNAS